MRKLRLAGLKGPPLAVAAGKQVCLPGDAVNNTFFCVGSACVKGGILASKVASLPPVHCSWTGSIPGYDDI